MYTRHTLRDVSQLRRARLGCLRSYAAAKHPGAAQVPYGVATIPSGTQVSRHVAVPHTLLPHH